MYSGPTGTLPRPTIFMTSSMATSSATRVRVFVFFIFSFPPAAVPPYTSDTAQTCPLYAGFKVNIQIIWSAFCQGVFQWKWLFQWSHGKRMPALRRATVSTRLTAMVVSCIRPHSS